MKCVNLARDTAAMSAQPATLALCASGQALGCLQAEQRRAGGGAAGPKPKRDTNYAPPTAAAAAAATADDAVDGDAAAAAQAVLNDAGGAAGGAVGDDTGVPCDVTTLPTATALPGSSAPLPLGGCKQHGERTPARRFRQGITADTKLLHHSDGAHNAGGRNVAADELALMVALIQGIRLSSSSGKIVYGPCRRERERRSRRGGADGGAVAPGQRAARAAAVAGAGAPGPGGAAGPALLPLRPRPARQPPGRPIGYSTKRSSDHSDLKSRTMQPWRVERIASAIAALLPLRPRPARQTAGRVFSCASAPKHEASEWRDGKLRSW